MQIRLVFLVTNLEFGHIYLYDKFRGDILKEYKRCLSVIRTYLNDTTLKLNVKKLDTLISQELEKPANEMDTKLIDLCLNALVAYRVHISERDKQM